MFILRWKIATVNLIYKKNQKSKYHYALFKLHTNGDLQPHNAI